MPKTSMFDLLSSKVQQEIIDHRIANGHGDIDGFQKYLKEKIGIEVSRSWAGEYSKEIKQKVEMIMTSLLQAKILAEVAEEMGDSHALAAANALQIDSLQAQLLQSLYFKEEEAKELDFKSRVALLELLSRTNSNSINAVAKIEPIKTASRAKKQVENSTGNPQQEQTLRDALMAKIMRCSSGELDALYPKTEGGETEVADPTT